MKRGVLILTIIFLLAFLVAAAPSTTLTAPDNGATESSTVNFKCDVTDATTMHNISLYTKTLETWSLITTNTTSGTTHLNHTISSLTDGTYEWNCIATNELNEISWASSNYTFTVSSLTFTGTIANQTLTEDTTTSNAFDLDTYFTGATTYLVSGNSSINISIDGDNQVSYTPGANFSNSETIRFAGTDGSTTVYSNYVFVNVTPVNDNPALSSNISNQSWSPNTNKTLTLSSYFTDIDGDTLNYTVSSTSYITINISAGVATMTPQSDWTGSETVTFTASDGTLSALSNTVNLTVNGTVSSNSAPTIDTYSPDSDPTIDPGASQDFSITYSDSDNDTLTVTWYLDGSETVTADSYTFTTETEETYTVKVEVSDATETTTRSWTVTVGSGSAFTEIDENIAVNSILGEQTSSSNCGNGIIEDGETCSNCALDIICEKGFICQSGTCIEKKGSGKIITIFLIVLVILIGGSIGAYYFILLKKGSPTEQQKPKQFKAVGERPPADYTDFYKKK